MADIKNKNELKRRIDLFIDELDYSINEKFCKETMKMMREFIGHASHRLDCEDSRVKSLKKKLKEYKDLEEQGLLLRLQFKIGQKVYYIYESCIDKSLMIGSMVYGYSCLDFPREYFATKAEAEQKLKEMESD